jgi:hypothetical protein
MGPDVWIDQSKEPKMSGEAQVARYRLGGLAGR